jgi:hypothetical protein
MKVMFAVLVLALATLFTAAKPASAATTAGDLQSFCKDAEENHTKGALTTENGYCVGYIAGFLDLVSHGTIFRISGKFYGIMIIKDTSVGDAVVAFSKYMAGAHSVKPTDDASVAVLDALYDAKILAIVPVAENSQTQ